MVIRSPASKEDAKHQVEVSFKQMNDTQLFKINAIGFFVNHDVDYLCPTSKKKTMVSGCGSKRMDNGKYFVAFCLGGNSVIRRGCVRVLSGMVVVSS